MKKVTEVDPNFLAANIIVCVAASIKTDQFEALMKIESDCICIAGLCLQYDGTPFLTDSNFLCFIHQSLSDAFSTKYIIYP